VASERAGSVSGDRTGGHRAAGLVDDDVGDDEREGDVADLTGRRVLVTGASSGIGEATARAVVAAGGRVALVARRAAVVEALADELDGFAAPADVTDLEALTTAVDRAADHLGGLDGVVTSAGLVRPGAVLDADPADWRTMLEVNVLGTLHTVRAAAPHLQAAGRGDVVTLSSMTGRRLASTEMGVYAATKAGVHALSEGLRRELSEHRVRVTVVAPGLVETPIFTGQDHPVATRLGAAAPQQGLAAADVADRIVEVLAAPPHVVHVEVALLALDRR
jgi:NADP-dependent 3-hydroxy acid dehydrogenase YdfG